MHGNWKKRCKSLWKDWGVCLILAILIATSFKSAIADWYDIPTGSMIPTILVGDRIFVNKLAYDLKIPYSMWHLGKWSDPARGDIVVFYSPEDGKRLVKRVVGLPGDTIAMHKNHLVINSKFLKYEPFDNKNQEQTSANDPEDGHSFFNEYLFQNEHPVMLTPSKPAIRSFGMKTIPDGCYFMMGDNRDNSADSRYFGFVDRNKVIGRATSVVFSRHSFPNFRWSRFFKELI